MSYDEQYEILCKNVENLKEGVRFTVSDVIASPLANVGKTFRNNVNKGMIKNVRLVGNESGVDEYEKIKD